MKYNIKRNGDLPVLYDSENIVKRTSWRNSEIQVAGMLHLTPTYVANVVKQVTGSTAGDCISEILIRKAKSLLRTSTLSVQEISDRLGFQNQSHFGTFFKRHEGCSPKDFRAHNHRLM